MGLMLSYKKYQPKYFNCVTGRPFKIKNISKYHKWLKEEYDDDGNIIYSERSDGQWSRYEYYKNKKTIYEGTSEGYLCKQEYDADGNFLSYEDVRGWWAKWEYGEDGKKTHYENSDGYWQKLEYNSDGYLMSEEDSNSFWEKWEYDNNGKLLNYTTNKI